MRIGAFIVFLFLLCSCSSKVYEVKGSFSESPIPSSPDYSKARYWASLPDKVDAADSVPHKTNLRDLQATAPADVFFIHPTTFTIEPKNQYLWNGDTDDSDLNNKTQTTTILNQASIFNGSCRIYAPYYRQAHLYAFYTPSKEDASKALDLAYADVRSAFEYYLKNYNQGRPIVIASHSQGSYHGERLIKDYFDGKELKKQLVAAYLIGRAIPTTSFTSIRPTEKPEEIGVWASWNTFARGFYPKNYELYYRKAQSTNPLLWNSSEVFASKELNKGGVAFHFSYAPQLADAQNHQGLLWINKPYFRGRFFIRKKRWHIADLNLFYMNIRENVALRIETFLGAVKSSPSTGK